MLLVASLPHAPVNKSRHRAGHHDDTGQHAHGTCVGIYVDKGFLLSWTIPQLGLPQ